MKLLCVNTDNVMPGLLIVGNEYELTERWAGTGCYEVNDTPVRIENFEGVKDRFKRLSITANKIMPIKPVKGVTVDLLLTDNYIIIYGHTKGTHWNIGGNHYKYYHDANTGEFIPDHEVTKHNKPFLKERFVMADYKQLEATAKAKTVYNSNN